MLLFENFEPKCANLGLFGPKSINSLVLTKFRMCSISKVLISNLTLVFENFEPKCPNLSILGQRISNSSLNKVLPVPYFEGADFKSDFRIQSWIQGKTQEAPKHFWAPSRDSETRGAIATITKTKQSSNVPQINSSQLKIHIMTLTKQIRQVIQR